MVIAVFFVVRIQARISTMGMTIKIVIIGDRRRQGLLSCMRIKSTRNIKIIPCVKPLLGIDAV